MHQRFTVLFVIGFFFVATLAGAAPDRAEVTMKALAAAYPWRIQKCEFRNDDWAILIDSVWYVYAERKFLPEGLLDKADDYFFGSFSIPFYFKELPPWKEPTPEQVKKFREDAQRKPSTAPVKPPTLIRSHHFHEALWQMSNHEEGLAVMKTINFLGYSLTVHSSIAEMLVQIDKLITVTAKNEPQVKAWVDGIGEVHGWNWRNVPGSQVRSYHSYGIAIDILPKSLEGKETFWQWAEQNGKEWFFVKYEDRYHPPQTVIKIFESYGFIWGGQWQYYDTMHFEYRPETYPANGLPMPPNIRRK